MRGLSLARSLSLSLFLARLDSTRSLARSLALGLVWNWAGNLVRWVWVHLQTKNTQREALANSVHFGLFIFLFNSLYFSSFRCNVIFYHQLGSARKTSVLKFWKLHYKKPYNYIIKNIFSNLYSINLTFLIVKRFLRINFLERIFYTIYR